MNYITEIKNLINKNELLLGANNTGLLNYNLIINPCISDLDLKILENKFDIELPEEYRDYLMFIGNGGNQPGDGMFTVEQSLALMFGQKAYGDAIDYKNLTKYYHAVNFSGCDNLLDCYYDFFGESCDINSLKFKSLPTVLDEFYTEDGFFKYHNMMLENEDVFIEYESAMKLHMLVFGFDDTTRTQYAIAMDGEHKNQVVYYSYEPIAKLLSGRNIVFTKMTFLEWMYHLYNSSCNPYKIGLLH